MNIIPKIGQILYEEKLDENGALIYSALLYVDTEFIPDEGLYVTWIAQMEDFEGNGLEVYTNASSGGSNLKNISRIATDDDIKLFVEVIKKSKNSNEKLDNWIKNINEAEDFALLLSEEKERLKRIINQNR